MTNNHFQLRNNIYHQIKETSMGTNMAPEYANLYLADSERKFIPMLQQRWSCLYIRYTDNICLICPTRHSDLTTHATEQHHGHASQIDWTKPSESAPILDLEISFGQ